MDIRPHLNQYDEPAFLGFVEAIWQLEADQASHNEWITHFNQIVGHPDGSDLLFYPNLLDDVARNSPQHIVETIKWWYRQNGQAAFKDQLLQPPVVHQTLSREQRANQLSTRNLENGRKLIAEVHAAELQTSQQLDALERSLAADPAGSTPEQQLALSVEALRTLVTVQHQAKRAVYELQRLEMGVRNAHQAAVREATSPFYNAAIQAVLLQEITAGSQRHAGALAAAQARHPGMFARGVELIERLEARVAQLARATGTGPGHGPLTLAAAAATATLHPALLTAQGLSREISEQQHPLIKSVRSAVAEMEWQATSAHGEHPGTHADILQFVLGTPSDDPRFAVTVPLYEMLDNERSDWEALAAERAEVDLPVRLCSALRPASGPATTGVKPFTRYSHVLITSTQGSTVASRVRVRPADWDAARQAFAFSTDGGGPVTVLWQKGRSPHKLLDHWQPPTIGFLRIPEVPSEARFADLAQVQFDDYIVVFPADSGLTPLYLMFRDRREL
ncbi:S-type pyocin domain-containing protein [Pantoea sp. Tr-811]|uniref:S-type pyocin domain-containing protein n=1 Tax=Pantoea sp. Tr-811 TaxID=2608361 RepID=UPI00141F83ED|nr:S-type pyocin domain-containing protein [Pantoea sp. Tr-811]NIF30123.1 S-type pyocin domain-containing protein [Pantoea sp. Tr-811]